MGELDEKEHARLCKYGLNTKMCISNVQQLNKNSIEFFLSTWTRRVSKSSRLSYYTVVRQDWTLGLIFLSHLSH